MNLVRLIFLIAVLAGVLFYGYVVVQAARSLPIDEQVLTLFGIVSAALGTNLGIVIGIRITAPGGGGLRRLITLQGFGELPSNEKLAEIAALLYFLGLLVAGILFVLDPAAQADIIKSQALAFAGVVAGVIANLKSNGG